MTDHPAGPGLGKSAGVPPATIRAAAPDRDSAVCAAIYAPSVTDSVTSFEEVAPSARELAARIRAAHVWLVAEVDGDVVGYAYGSTHRERAAYRWAADVSIYLDAGHRRAGIARALYTELFARLRAVGIRMLCAGVTLPNPASCGLHEALGFTPVGTYRRIGYKFGAWQDVRWYQLELVSDDGPPPELISDGRSR